MGDTCHLLGFMVQGKDYIGRCTNNPAGCYPSGLSLLPSRLLLLPPSISPSFHAGYPSCYDPRNLIWLGIGTKYAGLHTQTLGSLNQKQVSPK